VGEEATTRGVGTAADMTEGMEKVWKKVMWALRSDGMDSSRGKSRAD
jgi:hypothetical protein